MSGDLEGMISLTPEGELRWFYAAEMEAMTDPAMDYNGNVYFVASDQSPLYFLVSMTNDGIKRWEYKDATFQSAMSSVVCDRNSTIYVANHSNLLCSLTSDGNLNWKIDIAEIKWDCPAIAFGKLFFGTGYRDDGGRFYCIK